MIAHSVTETQKLAFDLLKRLKGQNVLALIGDLGSGKTTLTQGIARALGITQRVVSPTFVLMRTYDVNLKSQISKLKSKSQISNLKNGLPFEKLYHLDLYRLQNIQEIKELGVEEIWQDPKNLVIIEWAEKIRSILPKNTVWVEFRYVDKKTREILISSKLKSQNSNLNLKS